MRFDSHEFGFLSSYLFDPTWPGYTPDVLEAPNGDSRVDTHKRYSHLSPKYINAAKDLGRLTDGAIDYLSNVYCDALRRATQVCADLQWCKPGPDSTLRALIYPINVGGEKHVDFDLMTLQIWRSHREGFKREDLWDPMNRAQQLTVERNHGIHFGRFAEELYDVPPTPHWVDPAPFEQRSLVFFVVPEHSVYLPPSKCTVGEYLKEFKTRARVPA